MPGSAIHDVVFGGVTLKQCRNVSYTPSNNVVADYTSGDVAPVDHYLVTSSPQATFSTGDLDGVIDGISSQYLQVTSGTITIPYNLRTRGGTFAGNLSHDQINATDGLIAITSITASQGDTEGSSVSMQARFDSSDGETAPVTISTGQTLSANAYNCTHKLGPVTVNGSSVTGISSVTINTGINILPDMLDGAIYPTAHYIDRVQPTIEITGRRMSLFTALGPIFSTQTACVVKLRKRASGGTVVAGGTGAHISATFADGIVSVEQVSGSGNSDAEVTLRLYGEALTLSTTATI